jgi:hypothetical protein
LERQTEIGFAMLLTSIEPGGEGDDFTLSTHRKERARHLLIGSLKMLTETIAKLESEVDSLLTLTLTAYERFLFLRPMMVHKGLNERIESEGKRLGFERLRNWLYWALVQELIKICSDNDRRTPCIANFRKQLRDKKTLSGLEDKYSTNNKAMFSEEDLRSEFRSIYSGFQQRSDEMLSSNATSGYKKIRDKLISHNELQKSESGYSFFDVRLTGIKFGDEWRLLQTVRSLVDDLMSLIRNTDFGWQRSLDPATKIVCHYWQIETIED